MLSQAQRPLLVLGGGARRSGAHAIVRSLVELLGMPVMTTPSGRGILPEDHPLSIGQVGLYRTRLGMQAFEDADLLVTVGSRNEEFQTGAWKIFPPGAKLIQVDIEAFEIGRLGKITCPSSAMPGWCLPPSTLDCRRSPNPRRWRFQDWQSAKEVYVQEIEAQCRTDAKPIKTKSVVRTINHVFGKNTILVHENGGHRWTYYSPYYQVLDIDGCIAPGEQTLMGCGVMGAVGAKLARPDMKVVCVTGDGAFQMYNQDVVTAVQYHAPVTWGDPEQLQPGLDETYPKGSRRQVYRRRFRRATRFCADGARLPMLRREGDRAVGGSRSYPARHAGQRPGNPGYTGCGYRPRRLLRGLLRILQIR